MQIILSDDLVVVTAEINSFKQVAGQAVFEIGKRLKHVRDSDLAKGQFKKWAHENCDFDSSTASRFIQAFEQFGDATSHLPMGKIFEMLSLPETVDRAEFLEQSHLVPSTGEEKTVNEMTNKELREVKKKLQEAESRAIHNEKLWKQAVNQPPRIETKTVEVIPDTVKKKIEKLEFENVDLRHGYKNAKEKLQHFELRDTDNYDAEKSQKELERLQKEADISTVELRIAFKNFIEKAAISGYLQGAIATASQGEKERLAELVDSAEQIINQTKSALKGRRLGVVNE